MTASIEELLHSARMARREHRLAEAHADLVKAIKLCRREGARRQLIQSLKALGQIDRDSGQGEAARTPYEEAVALCRLEGDVLLLAHTVRHLGDLHQDAGRLAEAAPCYDEALAFYRNQTDTNPLDLANAIRPLAILKDTLGERTAAKVLWQEARELYADVGVEEGVTECDERLSRG